MNPQTLETSARFLKAAASYFGVPPDQLILGGQLGTIDGVFKLQFTIAITPHDLIGITHRMVQLADPEAQIDQLIAEPRAGMSLEQSEQFDAEGLTGTWRNVPTVQDVIRNPEKFVGVAGLEDIVESAAKLSKTVRAAAVAAYEAEAANMSEPAAEQSEGIGGRKVIHVDAPEDGAESALPAAVWVPCEEVSQEQVNMRSDYRYREDNTEAVDYLLQVALLTPEQRDKYGVKE